MKGDTRSLDNGSQEVVGELPTLKPRTVKLRACGPVLPRYTSQSVRRVHLSSVFLVVEPSKIVSLI